MNESDISKHYFNDIDYLGNLDLESVMDSFEGEPILFTCSDANGFLYLCLCSEIRYGTWWVIGRLTDEVYDDLVSKRIDIRNAFLTNEYSYMVHLELGTHKETCEKKLTVELANTDLPEEGVFFESFYL